MLRISCWRANNIRPYGGNIKIVRNEIATHSADVRNDGNFRGECKKIKKSVFGRKRKKKRVKERKTDILIF